MIKVRVITLKTVFPCNGRKEHRERWEAQVKMVEVVAFNKWMLGRKLTSVFKPILLFITKMFRCTWKKKEFQEDLD